MALAMPALVAMRQFKREGVNRHEAHRKKIPRAAAGAVKTRSDMKSSPDGIMTTNQLASPAEIVSLQKREILSRLIEAMSQRM